MDTRIAHRLAVFAAFVLLGFPAPALAQESVARQWNEALLNAIRNDASRPTVHARNLFHTAVAMYDAWAAFDDRATPVLLGKTFHGFTCPFYGIAHPSNVQAAREETISYAAYRLLKHRFQHSPGASRSIPYIDSLFAYLGYDSLLTSTDYRDGNPAALGNYIGESVIRFGLQDGSNEQGGYASLHYQPFNPALDPTKPGTSGIIDPNRWQPLKLGRCIGQSGLSCSTDFVTPEWGRVAPFALKEDVLRKHQRDGYEYWVYHDPGDPPYLDTLSTAGISQYYRWAFELNSIWSSQLDPTDGVMWDISPGSLGNVQSYPSSVEEYASFYDLHGGGDTGKGRAPNPKTGSPYQPQLVPRGDYARVLAEFWADGPRSETPPGHWFTILNYVTDSPPFERRFQGQGPVLGPLEWDVKAYLALGGAVHDAAISAWGIKGWYDYVRPISAIRCMGQRGQSTDPELPSFDAGGLPLVDGYVELVEPGDSLAGPSNENVGKVKVRAWRGPPAITDPSTERAGVGWVLAENWWPYQLPTFVTPPFAGYISGHSTFSRAGAVILERLTGDPFFPGGMGEFHAPQNQFLRVEEGPSVDVTLQWATYRDASDQCSLSRIWTGFHPPIDDMPGRFIGETVASDAFELAKQYFSGTVTSTVPSAAARVYPNPVSFGQFITLEINRPIAALTVGMYDIHGRLVRSKEMPLGSHLRFLRWDIGSEATGIYFLRMTGDNWESTRKICIVK